MSSQSLPLTHGVIVKRYRRPIAATFLLLSIENAIQLLEPFVLGLAIDGLISGRRAPFFIFLLIAITGLAVGVVRRVLDTRAYGKIYRELAVEITGAGHAKNAEISQMSARTSFLAELTEFFEVQLPVAFMSAVTLLGSVFMLFVVSNMLGVIAVLVSIAVGSVFFLSRQKIETLNARLNDEYERQVRVLSRRSQVHARRHFFALTQWQIRLSDLEARNFGIAFLFAILLTAASVLVLVAVRQESAGQVFAGLTYVLQFTEAMVMLPYTYQQFLRTREISKRMILS